MKNLFLSKIIIGLFWAIGLICVGYILVIVVVIIIDDLVGTLYANAYCSLGLFGITDSDRCIEHRLDAFSSWFELKPR